MCCMEGVGGDWRGEEMRGMCGEGVWKRMSAVTSTEEEKEEEEDDDEEERKR